MQALMRSGNDTRTPNEGACRLRGVFLPFTSAEHRCLVTFKDGTHGSFVYELIGRTLPPAVLAEHRQVLDCSRSDPVFVPVPFENAQIEAAKKTFMEVHPLAKAQSERLHRLRSGDDQSV